MKKILFLLVFIVLIIPTVLQSQQSKVCDLIGKKSAAVINKYGKPLHHDKSNPLMECIFYQTQKSKMAFIADKDGVYQIQIDYFFNSKNEAEAELDGFLSECGSNKMVVDTINAGDYKIVGTGVKMDLTLFENSFSKKYEIKFKASRSENK